MMRGTIRTGLVTGGFLVFLTLIGAYSTFQSLTLGGLVLTLQGATASQVAAQVPSMTNQQFSRIFTVLVALVAGALAARQTNNLAQGVGRAGIANAIAGAMMGLLLILANALYAAGFNVAFVFEKLTQATVNALLFVEPLGGSAAAAAEAARQAAPLALQQALVGGLIWAALMAIGGIIGALVLLAWRALHVQSSLTRVESATRISGNQARIGFSIVGIAFLLIAPQFIGVYWNQVLGSIGLFVLLGLGLNIVVGFAGLLDLGYVGFYAIGAYTIAVLTSPAYPFGWNFWTALPIAMIAAALAGTLLGIPVLRLRGDYLAIVTLGFGEIIRIIFKFNPYTGGPQGILNVAAPTFTIPIINYTVEFSSSTPFWYLILFACIIVAFIATRLNDSRLGRSWTAMREDEDATDAMGIDTVRIKLLAFGTGAFFAGLGGAIFASRQQHIFPDDFTLLVSINALALIIIGGLGSIPGVIIGSIVLIGLPEVLRPIADFRLLAYSALLVIMMLVRPAGLIPATRQKREFRERDQELGRLETS